MCLIYGAEWRQLAQRCLMLFQAEFRFTLNTNRWNARDFQAGGNFC